MRQKYCAIFIGIFSLLLIEMSADAQIISPEEAIGFPVGADYKLARWETITGYLRSLAASSDRVILEERGKTTEGLDFVLVLISSPENLANLDRYKAIQQKLANPQEHDLIELERLAQEGKAIVMISCNIHSTEVASSQMSMELAYQLATENTPEVEEILENTILLLIPSANPDGLNMVVDWYEHTVNTPYEGAPMPWLYHKYTGHDNNRDWFMLTQVESQLVTQILYEEWFPQVVYDVHQMGNKGARFVIPPYFHPVNPNIPPLLQREARLNRRADGTRSHIARVHRGAVERGVRYVVARRFSHCTVSAQHDGHFDGGCQCQHRFANLSAAIEFEGASTGVERVRAADQLP